MNEQRQDAYVDLIIKLLNCPSEDEGKILEANKHLLDAEFLQMVEAVAKMMSEEGRENDANWLRNLGNQLAEHLNESSLQRQIDDLSEEDFQAYLQVLMQILQATVESKGDAEVIYPLFAANTDKLDDNFAKILRRWATNKFEEAEADEAEYIATVIVCFGDLIAQFPLGNKASNMEIAIASNETVLKIFTQQAFPKQWAQTHNNLGNAYSDRIVSNKAENIEQAIKAYTEALKVFTRQAFPEDWAKTQNNLGIAYCKRMMGDRAQNIEEAIKAFNLTLEIFTYQAFAYQWATQQHNLGNAYLYRILGDREQNIEQAIQIFNRALEIFTRPAFSNEWAMIKNALGGAYIKRMIGDKADNIKDAIATYKAVLEIYTRERFPHKWAMIQRNLGAIYRHRSVGDSEENIKLAITACNAALSVYTRETFPEDWAIVQNELGAAYCCYYELSEDQPKYLENSIKAFNAALQVRTRKAFPLDCAKTLFNLGLTYQFSQKFDIAYTTYKSVIDIAESLRGEIISGEESKRKQAEEWNRLYRCIVEVCLELGDNHQAVEYIERSKTRNLVELILQRDFKTIFTPEVATQLQQLRDKIAKGQYQIQNGTAENYTALAQHLQELRQQKKNLEDKYLPVGSGFDFNKFQTTLDKNTVVIEWYITTAGLETFIITYDNLQRFKSSASIDKLEALRDYFLKYIMEYHKNRNDWIENLIYRLSNLAEILQIEKILKLIPKKFSRLILIPHRYLYIFPLHALPIKLASVKRTANPSITLFNGTLFDLFSDGVSYAPSCQLLQQINLRQRLDFKSLFAIQNPTEDLAYTDLEVETISSLFNNKEILSKKQATQTALSQASSQIQQANYLHFSCHGKFNFFSPQDSCLLLAGAVENDELNLNKCLTLGNLFERDFNLNQCRLVVLSACETGFIYFNNPSDEYISLSSGFLYAGSSSVVSSLWTVNDLSTSFLTIKFIQNLKNIKDISVPVALNQAQNWLREATKEDLQKWVRNLPLDSTKKRKMRSHLKNYTVEKPFNSPYHWAAFTAVGK